MNKIIAIVAGDKKKSRRSRAVWPRTVPEYFTASQRTPWPRRRSRNNSRFGRRPGTCAYLYDIYDGPPGLGDDVRDGFPCIFIDVGQIITSIGRKLLLLL